MRRKAKRRRSKPDYIELEEAHKEARGKLIKVIKNNKNQCWEEFVEEVHADPWSRPYKVIIEKMES